MNYDQMIDSGKVVLVEFFASWCPHCQRMEPIVEQVKKAVAGKATVYQIDVDRNSQAVEQEGVNGLPTFILYKNGNQIWRIEGEVPEEMLLNKVESA